MNKKILLMCPDFFGYDKLLLGELSKNYEVDFYNNNYIEKQNKFKRKFLKRHVEKSNINYYKEILNKIKNKRYDYFLFIKGNNIPNEFFEKILELNKLIKIISYQWDDIENCIEILKKQKYITKLYSYSKYDAQKYNLIYYPMFIKSNKFNEKKTKKEYDILNIGTLHENRIKMFNILNTTSLKIKNYIVIDNLKIYLKYLFLKNKKYKIEKKALPYNVYIELIKKSKAILDLPVKNQKGLTTRVLEGLSNGTKVITFNSHIEEYEFYNNENILILNKIDEEKIKKFLLIDFNKKNEELYEKYTIKNWIKKILEGE